MQLPEACLSKAKVAVAYDEDPLNFLLGNARTHGPVVQLCPGTVMVTGRSEAMSVLRATGTEFFLDRDFLNRELAPEQGSDPEKAWLAARRATVAEMTPERIRRHMEWFMPRAEAFTTDWLRQRMIGDLRPDLEHLTAASITVFCLGESAGERLPSSAQELLDALFPIFASPFRLPKIIRRFQPSELRVKRALHDFHAVLRSELTKPSDNLSLAASLRTSCPDDALVAVLRSLLLAAHDVPASALAWAVSELAGSGKAQDDLADAASRWDGTGAPPPLIGRFVDETLRLWPPTWGLSRIAGEQATCGPYQVPAGSTIIVPLWVLHRVCPSYADRDPERFDPDRWLAMTPRPGEYLPFSGGPRWCPGERLARAELAAVVAVLARRTRLSLRGEVRPDTRRTLTPRGFALEVIPR